MHEDARSLSRQLAYMLTDTRKRTLELVSDLNDEQMRGPKLRIVNPPLWEIGHLAWFQELWVLRRDEGNGRDVDDRGDSPRRRVARHAG